MGNQIPLIHTKALLRVIGGFPNRLYLPLVCLSQQASRWLSLMSVMSIDLHWKACPPVESDSQCQRKPALEDGQGWIWMLVWMDPEGRESTVAWDHARSPFPGGSSTRIAVYVREAYG